MSMSKKRGFLRAGRWLLLFLVLWTLLWINESESEAKSDSFLSELWQEGIQGFRRSMVEGQSIIIDLLAGSRPVFFEKRTPGIKESSLPFDTDGALLSVEENLLKMIEQENRLYSEMLSEEEKTELPSDFQPAKEKNQLIVWEEYSEPGKLLKGFYTVDSTTEAVPELFNLDTLMQTDCSIDKNADGPQILLYHTHSQEAFIDSIPGDISTTIVGAGDILTGLLESYGYQVLHHEGQYDVESRDYAYSNSLPEIERILKENPSIQVVLDLHRDAVAEGTKLLADVAGRPTAKIMFFNGLGRTKNQGEISYLKNPYLQENLAFSFQMKALCDQYYPGFARNIYLRAYRYNMHVSPKTLLIELGAQTNTVQEIHNALEPLAQILDMVLSGKKPGE